MTIQQSMNNNKSTLLGPPWSFHSLLQQCRLSKLANLIQRVKKETSELLFSNLLATFNPPKKEEKSLASLAREVKGQESTNVAEKVKERNQ